MMLDEIDQLLATWKSRSETAAAGLSQRRTAPSPSSSAA
jgi:hypothetical protein